MEGAPGYRNSSTDCGTACTVLREHGFNEPLYHGSVHIETATPKDKDAIREEYYKTYDSTTGLRIAATLGGFILFLGLILLYKTKCKGNHHHNHHPPTSGYTKTAAASDADAAAFLEVLPHPEVCVLSSSTTALQGNNVGYRGSYTVAFPYSHFQAKMADGCVHGAGAAAFDTPPSQRTNFEGGAVSDFGTPQTKETPLSLASFHQFARRSSRQPSEVGLNYSPGWKGLSASNASNLMFDWDASYGSSPRNPSLTGDQLLREWGLLPNSRRASSHSGSHQTSRDYALPLLRKSSDAGAPGTSGVVGGGSEVNAESICLVVPSLHRSPLLTPEMSETKC